MKKKIEGEIVKRLLSGNETATRRLLNDGYHSSLSNEEILQLINDFDIENVTDRVLINLLLVLRYLAEKRLSLIKEQTKQIIRRIFLAERFFVIRFIFENGILRQFKLYTEGAIYPYLSEEEIKELIEQLDLLKILTLEYKLRFEILSGVANLGSLKSKTLLKQEIRKSLIHGDFSIIQFLIQGFYLNRFPEEDLNRIYQTIDIQKITSSESLEVFPILKEIASKNSKIEETLKEEISKRFLQGEFNTVEFLMRNSYLYRFSEAERKVLIENLNFSKIIKDESPQMIPLLERLAKMGSKKAKSILEKEIIKRFLSGDFTTITTSIPKLSYIPNEKIIELLRDFNYKKITTKKPKIFLPLLLKISQLGSPVAIEVLKKEVKNIMQNGNKEEIIFLMNSVGGYIDIEHYFHFFSESELDIIFRSLDYTRLVEKKFEMLNIPDVEKNFLIELQKSIKKQFQILTNDYEISGNHIVKLNLSNKSIKLLPESICDLVALSDLNLNFNNLKVLPESIGELKSLVSLKAITNNLEFLPETIKNLENLEYLDLRFNQLKEIPSSIGELLQLKWILLSCNDLKNVPRSIGAGIERRRAKIEEDVKLHPHKRSKGYSRLNKIKIKELDLSGNDIKEFPLSKDHSTCELLDLSDTPFLTNYIDFQNLLIISQLNKWGISWKEKLSKFLLSYEVDFYEEIVEAIKPKFIMKRHYIRDETNIDIGVSKFGGNPDVPNNFVWPYWAGRPLSFLMQLNIADMNQFKYQIFSVQKGILYFFYDPYQEEWGANPLNKNAWRVIYADEITANLKRRTNPSHNRRFTYPSCLITLYQDISLPRDPHHIFPDYSFKEINEIKHNYYEFYSNIIEDSLARYILKTNLEWLSSRTLWSMQKHFLFGYPDEIQEIGIWKGWTQLLQLGDDNIMRWRWGSGGIVHFLIKENDLKKNYYGDVRLLIDCT